MANLPDYIVKNFKDGVFSRLEGQSIPDGAAQDALNWITLGDHIELRRGQQVLGDARNGFGKITGLIVAERFDGDQIPFRARQKKIETYDVDTDTWLECGDDALGDDVILEGTTVVARETGLIAHYKLNEDASSVDIEDSSGNQTTAVASQNTESMSVAGKIGKAIRFNGIDDYIEISHNDNQLVTQGFSFSAWVNVNGAGESVAPRIIDKSSDLSGGDGFIWFYSGAQERAFIKIHSGAQPASEEGSLPIGGGWKHIAVTVDSNGNAIHYVNGVVSGTPSATGSTPSLITSTNPMRLGNSPISPTATFDGDIDDFRMYNIVLTAAEIFEIYNEGDGTEEPLDGSYDGISEDVVFTQYHSLAGATVYAGSRSSSIFKLMIANPTDIVDQLSTDHRGKIAISNGRMFLWDRKGTNGGKDTTGLYGSWIDKDELSDYTEVIGESIGASGSTNYTGTLAFKAAGSKRTCLYVTFSATTSEGTEAFIDDRNGNLTSNFGGTGTINYATGEYDITFNSVTTGAVTSGYYWEDATDEGVVDFSKSATRVAGEGFVLRQDDGGADFQNIANYGGSQFCFHIRKTWKLTLASDDSTAAQEIYRSRVGIPYWKAMVATGDGIYYVDDTDASDPFIRLLTFAYGSEQILPKTISDNIKLSDYSFDQSEMIEWGVYIVISCRTKDSTINNRKLFYHKLWKSWDITDFRGSFSDEYNGLLITGDSGSDNVFTLFDSFADEESEIPNFWTSGKTNLGIEGVKKTKRFVMRGIISLDQFADIEASFDDGDFIKIGEVRGNGTYVDTANAVTIGSQFLGEQEIGGDANTSVDAFPYSHEFSINSQKYEYITLRIKALGIGYISISEYQLKDNRYKGRKLPTKYRT